MSGDEYAALVAYVTRLWPHAKHVDGQWEAAVRLLRDLTAGEAAAAVDRLAATGREFPPPPGAIRREAILLELVPAAVAHEQRAAAGLDYFAWAEAADARLNAAAPSAPELTR